MSSEKEGGQPNIVSIVDKAWSDAGADSTKSSSSSHYKADKEKDTRDSDEKKDTKKITKSIGKDIGGGRTTMKKNLVQLQRPGAGKGQQAPAPGASRPGHSTPPSKDRRP
jgi:hypothetical protein